MKYQYDPTNESFSVSETNTYLSKDGPNPQDQYLQDIFMWSNSHPTKIYTVATFRRNDGGFENYYLQYLYNNNGVVTKVEQLVGEVGVYPRAPMVCNHGLSTKAMSTWDFFLDPTKKNHVDDIFLYTE